MDVSAIWDNAQALQAMIQDMQQRLNDLNQTNGAAEAASPATNDLIRDLNSGDLNVGGLNDSDLNAEQDEDDQWWIDNEEEIGRILAEINPTVYNNVDPPSPKRARIEEDSDMQFGGTLDDCFETVVVKDRHLKKWNAQEVSHYLKFTKPDDVNTLNEFLRLLHDAFSTILNRSVTDGHPDDKIRVMIKSPSLSNPISTPFTTLAEFSPDLVMAVVSNALQSNESLSTDETMNIVVQHIRMPQAGGKANHLHVLHDNAVLNLQSIVQIKTDDNLCLPMAILLGKCRIEHGPNSRQYQSLRKTTLVKSKNAAREFFETALNRPHDPNQMCTIEDVQRFQNYLGNFQLVVYRWTDGHSLLFKGAPDQPQKIFLLYHQQHFDLITKPTAFMRKHYFCGTCLKGYNDPRYHACVKKCRSCYRRHCPDMDGSLAIPCHQCGGTFPGLTCFNDHLASSANGQSLCEKNRWCRECGSRLPVRKNEIHVCRGIYCKNCRKNVPYDHLCYIKPVNEEDEVIDDELGVEEELVREAEEIDGEALPIASIHKNVEDFRSAHIIYFDIESYEDTDRVHHANLVIAQSNQAEVQPQPFHGEDCIGEFCRWALSNECKGATFVAHNMKKYDGYFILNWLLHNCGDNPDVMVNGGAIFQIKVPKCDIRFIDSINFLSCPLADMPTMFGKENDFAKGFFPHRFNHPDNYAYVGPMPARDYFDAKWMSTKRQLEFDTWYQEKLNDSNYQFNFQHELTYYCRLDVKVLRVCCEAFRKIFFDCTTVDPFDCVTIASACNMVYRKVHLRPNTIGIIPTNGYSDRDAQSGIAIKWLEYEAHRQQLDIRHALNGQEHLVNGLKIDGVVYENGQPTKRGFEFFGCFFHGHPECYSGRQINPLKNKPMGNLYYETMYRLNQLQKDGWQITVKWECQFKKEMKQDQAVRDFVEQHPILPPLNPRDAFFGGRTNAAVLCYEARDGEKIKYADINSLYPFINKNRHYPIGHPEILVGPRIERDNIRQYFGLIHCRVLPPTNLLHPVLPCRYRNKLMFTLCHTCAMGLTEDDSECNHRDDERVLHGTWATPELFAALDRGYQLLDVYEVWHYESSSDTLFRSYINTFLALKQESKGLPADLRDETSPGYAERLQAYIDEFAQSEGVTMDPTKLAKKKNAGLYQTAKLCLNSFWGKFGERPNKSQIAFCREEHEFWKLMCDQSLEISDVVFYDEDCAQVEYREQKEFVSPGLHTNVVVACFTTANARLHLYEALEKLGPAALYYDTDSVIYVHRDGEYEPPMGETLGLYKDEIGDGDYIVKFVSGGPKNYGYQTANGKTELKVRGFSLKPEAAKSLNFDVVAELIEARAFHRKININMGTTIRRSKKTWTLKTAQNVKQYRLLYDKRVLLDDLTTVPYGYRS